MNGLVILLCRNTLAMTRQCLPTILAQTAPINILVVDNASTDGTGKWIGCQQTRYSNLFRMTHNPVTSVARCWNEALKWAWDRGHSEALVVNNDTELLPETYARLKAYLGSNKVGVVTGVEELETATYPGDVILPRPHPAYSCYMIAAWAHRRIPFDEGYGGGYFEDEAHHVELYRSGIWAGSINLGFVHHRSSTLKHADVAEQERIGQHYLRNKARFLAQYGCVPGTKAYERLFLPDRSPKHLPAQDSQHDPSEQRPAPVADRVGLAGNVARPQPEDQPDHHQDPK